MGRLVHRLDTAFSTGQRLAGRCLGVPGKAEALAEIDRGRSEQVVIVGFDGG